MIPRPLLHRFVEPVLCDLAEVSCRLVSFDAQVIMGDKMITPWARLAGVFVEPSIPDDCNFCDTTNDMLTFAERRMRVHASVRVSSVYITA